MTLKPIVAAVGGDLYAGGLRANIPAPGHSASDRSISLLLSDGRVVLHSFGGADWRAARAALIARGWIDRDGRMTAGSFQAERRTAVHFPPDIRRRQATAERLWTESLSLAAGQASVRHLKKRCVEHGVSALALRHHPAAPISVFRSRSPTKPALLAGISGPDGRIGAVEIVYLDPGGGAATGLKLARKCVGVIPAGSAVRLAPVASRLLVGEGVATTLSAMARFGLPGWALLSAGNLAGWSPPRSVREILIAADRGEAGEAAAERLTSRLRPMGLTVRIRLPDRAFGDWNEAAVAGRKEREGRMGTPDRRRLAPPPAGDPT